MIITAKQLENTSKNLPSLSFNELLDAQYYKLNNDLLIQGCDTKNERPRKIPLRLAIDGEWDSEKNLNLGYSAIVEEAGLKTFIILNKQLLDNLLDPKTISRIEKYCIERSWRLFWREIDNETISTLSEMLVAEGYEKQPFETLFYYSAKDLWLAFGHDIIHEKIMDGTITQKRNISGEITCQGLKFKLYDLIGWSNSSLKDFAASVSVEMASKSDMDDYKSRMLDGLAAEPEKFLDYMVGDTIALFEIEDNFVKSIRYLQELIGVPESQIVNRQTIPRTTGAVVANTFESYLRYCLCPERQIELEYAFLKLGIIDPDSPVAKIVRPKSNRLKERIRDRNSLIANTNEVTELLKFNFAYEFEAFSQGSVKKFGKDSETSGAFLAIVNGGRCANERPREYLIETAADIDLRSAYATAIRKQVYPIGLPVTIKYTPNQERETLGNVLKRIKEDGTNIWSVVVEGRLLFGQDLIFSKLVTQKEIVRATIGGVDKEQTDDDRDDSISHIPGDFVLSRREIKNGIVTAEILEVIEKTASKKQWGEFMKLEVIAAAYYPEKQRCRDIHEWIDKVLADKGTFEVINDAESDGSSTIADTRTRAWYGLPLEDVVGGVVDRRNKTKKEAKAQKAEGNEVLSKELNAKQNALKLFVNTLYGVLASPYFKIGNTVVTNKITASARVAVWQMSKALNTIQSITDGGIYGLKTVNYLKQDLRSFKRPSLATLSDLKVLKESKYVENRSLGENINWEEILQRMFENSLSQEDRETLNNHDAIALAHIKEFWSVYDLDFHFEIEHKTDNYAQKVAYWNKADYAFDNRHGVRDYTKRGAENYQDGHLRRHPMYDVLDNILDGRDDFPEELTYDFTALMKIGKYKEVQNSAGYQNLKEIRTGERYYEERFLKVKNLHMMIRDIETFLKWKKNSLHKKRPQFERFGDKGIDYVHRKILASCELDK